MLFYCDFIVSDEMRKRLLQQFFNTCAFSQSGMVFTANQHAIHHMQMCTNNGAITDGRHREYYICFTVGEKICKGFIRCQNVMMFNLQPMVLYEDNLPFPVIV